MSEGRMIDINLDDTPDEILPVDEGIRILDVKDVKEGVTGKGDAKWTVDLQVNMPDCEDHERMMWDQFVLQYPQARVKFKQFCKSAGHTGSGQGVDPTVLIGTTVRAVVKHRGYEDSDTGETKQAANVKEYLFDAPTS